MTQQPPVLRRERESEPPQVAPPVTDAPPRSTLGKLLDSKSAMLAMLFLATAALGLPLLWKNRRFSRREKWIWSIIVSLYTIVVFWLFGAVMWWSYSRIVESLNL